MRDNPRSVMGNQFQITLPSEWRNPHGVVKGDKVYAHYSSNSVLIITSDPGKRSLTAAENYLIDLLIRLPEMKKTKELAEELRNAADMVQSYMFTPVTVTS